MFLTIIQIAVSVLLIGLILLQVQGRGLSGTFGGGEQFYRSRRSMEKFILVGTVILLVAFALVSILLLLPQK